MPEPSVGRIGYVIDGGGRGREIPDAKSEIHCNNCRSWFDGREHGCPSCGWERPGYNEVIRKGQLDRHLYESAGLRKPSGDFR